MALKLETVSVKKASEITKPADEGKFYNVVVQLGARRRWKHCGSGRWALEKSDGEKKEYVHKPAVHKVGPVPGTIVNGLIEAHNKFVRANHANETPIGDVGRMLMVNGMEQTAPPELRRAGLPFDLEPMIVSIVKQVVPAVVEAMLKAGGGK